jgi:hypothetical protein
MLIILGLCIGKVYFTIRDRIISLHWTNKEVLLCVWVYQYIILPFFLRIAYDNDGTVCMLLVSIPLSFLLAYSSEWRDVAKWIRLRETGWRETR